MLYCSCNVAILRQFVKRMPRPQQWWCQAHTRNGCLRSFSTLSYPFYWLTSGRISGRWVFNFATYYSFSYSSPLQTNVCHKLQLMSPWMTHEKPVFVSPLHPHRLFSFSKELMQLTPITSNLTILIFKRQKIIWKIVQRKKQIKFQLLLLSKLGNLHK